MKGGRWPVGAGLLSPLPSLSPLLLMALCVVPQLQGQGQQPRRVFDPDQTDILIVRTGDRLTGDFKELSRGIVTFKTDAMSTVQVKWTRTITASTRKQFEIHLQDGRVFVGSLGFGDSSHVVIRGESDTVSVPTQSVVQMLRLKRTFWQRLDGNFNLGLDFTQQNSKVDFSLSALITYVIPLNNFRLTLDGSFSSQDSVSNISRRDVTFVYARELGDNWIWTGTLSGQTNSQLDLRYAVSVGTGPGRYLVQSNEVELVSWIGPLLRREDYTGESPATTVPLALVTDFELFNWAGLSTDLTSRSSIAPVLNDPGRWQINFTLNVTRELVSQLYLTIGVTEFYDSKPPSNSNKNDFSLNSSLGWSF